MGLLQTAIEKVHKVYPVRSLQNVKNAYNITPFLFLDGKLDMRMNNRAGISAIDILNNYDEEKLSGIFYLYGELKTARKIAAAIVQKRTVGKITDIENFLEIIHPFINRKQEKKELAQLFQALRIEVNHEMDSLRKMLTQARLCFR